MLYKWTLGSVGYPILPLAISTDGGAVAFGA